MQEDHGVDQVVEALDVGEPGHGDQLAGSSMGKRDPLLELLVGDVGDRDAVAGRGGETLAGIGGLLLGGRDQPGQVPFRQGLLDGIVDGEELAVGAASSVKAT